MKRSLKELNGYTIEAKDGTKGSVKDFLFDEEKWIIRYLEADLGILFPGKKVLIPQGFLREPHWSNQHFPINLTKADIGRCPELAEDLPVSRRYEQELTQYYKTDDYWSQAYIPPTSVPAGVAYQPRPIQTPTKVISEKNIGTHLRSFSEVRGYHIQAIDGKLGHIDDMIIDDADWQIVYAVIDTSNWLPWSKRVLIGINSMKEISYVSREVTINLYSETIKSAPEFDPSQPINEVYEKQLYDYYGRRVSA